MLTHYGNVPIIITKSSTHQSKVGLPLLVFPRSTVVNGRGLVDIIFGHLFRETEMTRRSLKCMHTGEGGEREVGGGSGTCR